MTNKKNKNISPYDFLYNQSENHILWGDEPGRLIAKIDNYLKAGKILDAGCGDGKNALFLEKKGFIVTGYDSSKNSIQGLKNRFKKNGLKPKGLYKVKDIAKLNLSEQFDALVSYGLLHALPKSTRIATHSKLQKLVKKDGFLFFTCLTDKIPLPDFHNTEFMTLVDKSEIEKLLKGWQILYQEEGKIKETHPNVSNHKHYAKWLIAKKIN